MWMLGAGGYFCPIIMRSIKQSEEGSLPAGSRGAVRGIQGLCSMRFGRQGIILSGAEGRGHESDRSVSDIGNGSRKG